MKKYFYIILLLIIIGCSSKHGDNTSDYTCSKEQMDKSEAETIFCSDKGGHSKIYCYEDAIKRNCELKPRPYSPWDKNEEKTEKKPEEKTDGKF